MSLTIIDDYYVGIATNQTETRKWIAAALAVPVTTYITYLVIWSFLSGVFNRSILLGCYNLYSRSDAFGAMTLNNSGYADCITTRTDLTVSNANTLLATAMVCITVVGLYMMFDTRRVTYVSGPGFTAFKLLSGLAAVIAVCSFLGLLVMYMNASFFV